MYDRQVSKQGMAGEIFKSKNCTKISRLVMEICLLSVFRSSGG